MIKASDLPRAEELLRRRYQLLNLLSRFDDPKSRANLLFGGVKVSIVMDDETISILLDDPLRAPIVQRFRDTLAKVEADLAALDVVIDNDIDHVREIGGFAAPPRFIQGD